MGSVEEGGVWGNGWMSTYTQFEQDLIQIEKHLTVTTSTVVIF
jgi:hypothetical protein